MQMQRSKDGTWFHGCSSQDGYVIVSRKLVEQRYHSWLSDHPRATHELKQHMEDLVFSADVWETYAQIEPEIKILQVYAVLEEQADHQWHLCYRFWGKTRVNETLDEQSLKAWLLCFHGEQFLQSEPHPLSGVYMFPVEAP